eukprot:ANDGO_06676.mRNA.1 hypothetical protein
MGCVGSRLVRFVLTMFLPLAALTDFLLYVSHRCRMKAGRRSDRPFSELCTSYGRIRILDSLSTANDTAGKCTLFMIADGPVVIESFIPLVQMFNESGHRVVVMDPPGFGFSFPSYRYHHRVDQFCITVQEVFEKMGLSKAIVSATCANGLYALAFAKRNPHLVSGLILGQTPSVVGMRKWINVNIDGYLRIPILSQIIVFLVKETIPKRWFKAALEKGSSHYDSFKKMSCSALEDNGCFCLATLVHGLELTAEQCCVVPENIPIVCMWGKSDRTHNCTDPLDFLKLVPHAQMIVLEKTGHYPNLEHPALMLQITRKMQQHIQLGTGT